jgi:dolichol-phosphate mannosyltransferase
MIEHAATACAPVRPFPAIAKVVVVLPAFNEEKNLPGLFARIQSALERAGLEYEILVVDDGSTDQTRRVAEEWAARIPIRLYCHDENQGLGTTLRDGLNAAGGDRGLVVVTMDADETHDPELIPQMVRLIANGSQVVIASRYQPGARVEGLSYFRRLLSNFASLLFRALFPTPGVRDYTCGFRAYDAETLRAAAAAYGGTLVTEQGFQCMAGTLLKLRRLGLRFAEVPMVLRYNLKRSASKIKILTTVVATLRMMAGHLAAGDTPSELPYER